MTQKDQDLKLKIHGSNLLTVNLAQTIDNKTCQHKFKNQDGIGI